MLEVIERQFRYLFMFKLPQQVQAVLVSFQNSVVGELAKSVDRIVEITKTSNAKVCSIKEKSHSSQAPFKL